MISIAHILIMLLTVAVCVDFWKQIIPNELIYIGSTACILAMVGCCETEYLLRGLMQAGILFVCLFPAYRIRAIGAGDVKLFMMTGLFLAKENMFGCVFAAFLFGAVQGLIKLAGTKENKIHFSLPIFLSVLLKLGGVY